jgi:hypothetical protein
MSGADDDRVVWMPQRLAGTACSKCGRFLPIAFRFYDGGSVVSWCSPCDIAAGRTGDGT